MESQSFADLAAESNTVLAEARASLTRLLAEAASRLRPFPAFMGMVSLQALELEPQIKPSSDLGCVVVDPEGRICRLDLREISGISGLTEVDQVEEINELELTDTEFIIYATAAIRVLTIELDRRGR